MAFFNRVINFSRSLVSSIQMQEFLLKIWNLVTTLINGPTLTSLGFHPISMSSDGQVITVSLNASLTSGLSHYISTNGGESWFSSSIGSGYQNLITQSTSMNSNGQRQLALLNRPFLSTNYGATWNFVEGVPTTTWFKSAMSSDGSIITLAGNEQLYVSTDFGASFAARDSLRGWTSIAMSSDGIKQVAVVQNGQIYISTNSGTNWTAKGLTKVYRDVASSSDGSILTAATSDAGIYISTNFGQDWNQVSSLSSFAFSSVAMSSDGSIQSAVRDITAPPYSDEIYVSADYGSTWTKKQLIINTASQAVQGIAMSSNGKKQAAAVINGGQVQRSFI